MFTSLLSTSAVAGSSPRSQTALANREGSTSAAGLLATADSAAQDFSRALDRQLRDSARPREPERSPSRPAADGARTAADRTQSSRPAHVQGRAEDSNATPSPAATATEPGETESASVAAEEQSAPADAPPAQDGDASPSGAEAATIAGLPAALAALAADSAADEGEIELSGEKPAADETPLAEIALKSKAGTQADSQSADPRPGASAADAQAEYGKPKHAATTSFAAPLSTGSTTASAAAASLQTDDHDHVGPTPGGKQHGNSAPGAIQGLPLPTAIRHASNSPSAPQLPVGTAVHRQGWAEDVGNQVKWMIGRAESKAELVLTPPNLGKLEVSISLNGDQTTAQFIASTQAARDALEQALPRLREMLSQAGIGLGQTDVSTAGGQDRGTEEQHHRSARSGAPGLATSEEQGPQWSHQQQGLVDTFV